MVLGEPWIAAAGMSGWFVGGVFVAPGNGTVVFSGSAMGVVGAMGTSVGGGVVAGVDPGTVDALSGLASGLVLRA